MEQAMNKEKMDKNKTPKITSSLNKLIYIITD